MVSNEDKTKEKTYRNFSLIILKISNLKKMKMKWNLSLTM